MMMCVKPYYMVRGVNCRTDGSSTAADDGLGSRPKRCCPPPPTDDVNSKIAGTFRPFDRQSYICLRNRIVQARKDYGFVPHRVPTLKDGDILPRQYQPVPSHVYGRPVEEFDGISYEKTFCVISKRFSKNYMNRFSATRAFFMFTPWNPIRRLALFASTNQYFDYFVILTILVNCVFLALGNSIGVEESEYVFLSIYTTEMIIKSIAKGFIINKYTYLRSPWNWLDFVVIVLGFVTIFVELGNLSGLRTFRVLRALKTVSILPGLKTIVNALLHSISMLTEVMALTVFCLMVFALFGLQIFMGSFRRRCVDMTQYESNDTSYEEFIKQAGNWYADDGKYQLCGNSTGTWLCPDNYTCLPNVGENPNFGYSSFDNFGWAMLATFQLLTLDFWEDIYINIIATCGPSSVIFFIFMVFFGSFYLINLMLAVVAMSYEEEVSNEEAEKMNQRTPSGKLIDHDETKPQKQRTMVVTRRGVISVNRSIQSLKEEPVLAPIRSRSVTPQDKKPHPAIKSKENSIALSKESLTQTNCSTLSIPGNVRRQSNTKSMENGSATGISNHKYPSSTDDQHATSVPQAPKSVAFNRQDTFLTPLPPSSTPSTPIVMQPTYADRNCKCCQMFCLPCFYRCWLKIQCVLYVTVRDPFFELFITVCIIMNTIFLAVEHHGMSQSLKQLLNVGNKVFTVIFTLEAILKLLALCKQYFKNGWNVFDLIAVIGSLIDLSLENFNGLSVLRALRLLRVFKLAQSWTTMKILLSIILSSIGALGNLTLVLIIIMYIFAVLGMQLFGSSYKVENFYPEDVPRWNFKDFHHSFLMTFRILCGEWIEPLWDCMRANGSSGQACIALFLPALIMESFLVLNLFLALLLSSFNSDKLAKNKNDDEISNLAVGIRRLKYILTCCSHKKRNAVGPTMEERSSSSASQNDSGTLSSSNENEDNSEEISQEENDHHFSSSDTVIEKQKIKPLVSYVERMVHGSSDGDVPHNGIASSFYDSNEDLPEPQPQPAPKNNASNAIPSSGSILTLNGDFDNHHPYQNSIFNPSAKTTHSATSSQRHSRAFSSSSQRHSNAFSSSAQLEDVAEEKEEEGEKKVPLRDRTPEDCFPESVYKNCQCCSGCSSSYADNVWMYIRKAVLMMVDHPAFDWIVLMMIIASSICLCFEDVYLDNNQSLKMALHYLNVVFTILFTLEMLLKWLAHGFVIYFTNAWSILDFIIVMVAIVSLAAENTTNLTALRSMRTLRALRPLRAISRWQGMKIVVNALVSSIPSIVNVLLVCVVFWLVFSIMGVQFFAGKFYKCVNDARERLPTSEVNNRSECELKNYTWENSHVNFDHVGQGFLALFQVGTFEGWLDITADAVDSRDVDMQPEFEANMLAYCYFIVFIVCGSFFTLNLFIGVIIDNFNMLKKKYEGGVLDMFLTDSQKNYYVAMKKLGRKKPQKLMNRPKNRLQIFFYNLCMNRKFEMGVFLVIMMNMLSMGIEHYEQSKEVTQALDIINIIFSTIFTLEALVKIIAFRQFYFTVAWNIFDIVLVISSIIGIILKDLLTGFFISPTLLRVIRVFRIGRVLRLIKAAKGIRKLIFALMVSLPALFNIGALLFLIMFIYAIIGMSLFGYIKRENPISEMTNFETFGNSMLLLFRLITSAGWSDILGPLMVTPPDCDPHYRNLPNGDCGNPTMAVLFLVSYIIINNMIIINMYIAVILENFNQAHQEEELGIVEDDIEMFYVHWANFDPLATQFIELNKISDFLGGLDPPLRVAKPNSIALVSFNLPIAKGNKIHCLDILHALIKHALGHVDETTEFQKLRSQMEEKFKKQFPTRQRLEIISSTMHYKQQEVAARILQRAFRRWKTFRNVHESDTWSRSMGTTIENSVARLRKLSLRSGSLTSGRSMTPCRSSSAKASTRRPSSATSVQSFNSDSTNDIFYIIPDGKTLIEYETNVTERKLDCGP